MGQALFKRAQEHAELQDWSLRLVIIDALKVYFLQGRRAPQTSEAELVFRDMARLVATLCFVEKLILETQEKLEARPPSISAMPLECDLNELKIELRAVRFQIALHLGTLRKTRSVAGKDSQTEVTCHGQVEENARANDAGISGIHEVSSTARESILPGDLRDGLQSPSQPVGVGSMRP